ncbi:MAG: CoB--CoM heterodisulfide reductase iron-sulfur subunit B family protein [bacterium]
MEPKYSYYPGCSLEGTSKEFDISTRAVFKSLGVELLEIPDWICCGASPAHFTDEILGIALPVGNLIKAREANGNLDTMAPCAECYNRMRHADHAMRSDLNIRGKVEEAVGVRYDGGIKVRHILDVLRNDVEENFLMERVKKPLHGLKVASYYGCLLTRPPEIVAFEDEEAPRSMDDLVGIAGAEEIKWGYKTECCGASLSLGRKEVVLKLANDILQNAIDSGANCIAVACPLCHTNLDLRQPAVNKVYEKKFNLPIFFITELLGLSFGLEPRELGLNLHTVSPLGLLREQQIIR